MGSMDKEQALKLLDAAFDAGGNFIDTSDSYQNTQSESWIGEWMEQRAVRYRVVVARVSSRSRRSMASAPSRGLRSLTSWRRRRMCFQSSADGNRAPAR